MSEMKKYKFRIYTQDDEDGFNVWVSGVTPEEARREVESEYWGVKEILYLGELK